MKQLLSISLFCVILSSCSKKSGVTGYESKINSKDSTHLREITCTCKDTVVITDTSRSKLFSKAEKVELVYFETPSSEWDKINQDQIKNGKFTRKNIKKKSSINKNNILELEKILYNKRKDCTNGDVFVGPECIYQPTHAIVLYDNTNKAYAFLEICFFCELAFGSRGHDFGSMCYETYEALFNFFSANGVHP